MTCTTEKESNGPFRSQRLDAKIVHKEATQKKDTTSQQQYYTTAKACRYREELGYSNRQLGLQQKPSYSLFL